ncbi:Excitatory amino acid transporter 3 [Liparis tanakae]|uniref:Amino acid transporter n=1 Tax=Liparis tanakae TaxID=230148 RepID=A0A4Z2J182_9TELE|nr:Excitatory amino acid transporter 3 [Liparis tanakae]
MTMCWPYDDESHFYITFPGELLMGMFQCVSIPMMVTSIILGTVNLKNKSIKIALRAVFFFVLTTFIALMIGLILVLWIEPGEAYTVDKDDQLAEVHVAFVDSLMDFVSFLPIGLLFIIAGNIFQVYDWETIHKLREFVFVVVIGLLIHGCIALPVLYWLMLRRNPWHCINGALPALITALMTSSSSAAVPVTLRCCEERNGVDRRIARFALPIGTSINMNGSVIYEVVAVIFLTQLNDLDLAWSKIIEIW